MNYMETLLTQAQAEAKRMNQESYSEGFRDAEGTANLMQGSFNRIQNLLLSALGRKRHSMELTEDTAAEVVTENKRLKEQIEFMRTRFEWLLQQSFDNTLSYWQTLVAQEGKQGFAGVQEPLYDYKWYLTGDWSTWDMTPPALFGSSVGSSTNTATGASLLKSKDTENLQQKIERIKAYLLRHARENNKRAEKLENNAEYETDMRSSYFHSGKGEAYANAHKKVQEILG